MGTTRARRLCHSVPADCVPFTEGEEDALGCGIWKEYEVCKDLSCRFQVLQSAVSNLPL